MRGQAYDHRRRGHPRVAAEPGPAALTYRHPAEIAQRDMKAGALP
ncbi:MAG TPA: hypothetical protein VFB58_12205 [Chloroflexota bacterium]|nr:hypothetical protein [Chloroflexota bacterium]